MFTPVLQILIFTIPCFIWQWCSLGKQQVKRGHSKELTQLKLKHSQES
jgi:uncharacterized membrane protein (DUF106 family)